MALFKSVLIVCLFPFTAYAQTGMVHGVVLNDSGRTLAGAVVTLNTTNDSALVAHTDQTGYYAFSQVPWGDCEVVVTFVGQEPYRQPLTIDQPAQRVNIVVQAAQHQLEQVEVIAEKESRRLEQKPLAVKSVDIQEVISQNTVLSDVADRISGVRIRRSGSLGDASDVSINGVRGRGIRMYIDGLPMEIMYPYFDISTIPLSNIKRLDVYKGVVPIDVGTDAMGGAVNIVTEQRYGNSFRLGYYLGSFNTHMADIHVGLANKQQYFMNVSGAFNYSDNDYRMNAFVFENNRTEKVKRFHDAYQMSFVTANVGVRDKAWTDELRFTLNYNDGFKELQQGTRLTATSIGEARYEAGNYSGSVNYRKGFWQNRLRVATVIHSGTDNLAYRDTTRNVYSWSGQRISQGAQGELAFGLNDNRTQSLINRTTVTFDLSADHRFMASNSYASQKRTGKNHLLGDHRQADYLNYPQRLTKNISGVAYEGRFFDRLTFTTAAKFYFFKLDGVENNTFEAVGKDERFAGFHVAAKYEFDRYLHAKTSYERGFLIPFFEQFVGDGATILRNIHLRPESSDNLNASLGYERQLAGDWSVYTTVNGFLRAQYDVIYTTAGIIRRYENQEEVKTVGGEGELALRYKNWQLKSALTVLAKRFVNLKDPRNAYLEGTTFPNDPTRYGNVELQWQRDNFRVYGFYHHIGTFNHTLLGASDNANNRPELFVPAQHRFDAGVSYFFTRYHLTVALNAVNLANAELFDNFSIPKPGRNFNARLIYEINKF